MGDLIGSILAMELVLPFLATLGVVFALNHVKNKPFAPVGVNVWVTAFAFEAIRIALVPPLTALVSVDAAVIVDETLSMAVPIMVLGGAMGTSGGVLARIGLPIGLVWAIARLVTYDGMSPVMTQTLNAVSHAFVPGFGLIVAGFLFMRRDRRGHSSHVFISLALMALGAIHLASLTGMQNTDMWPYLSAVAMVGIMMGAMFLIQGLLNQRVEELDHESRKAKERSRLIVQSSPFPIIISRLKDDHLLLVNSKASDLFGIDSKNSAHVRATDYFADSADRQKLLSLFENQEVVEDFEVLVRRPGQQDTFWILISARVIDFEGALALFTAFQDITGRKQNEMKLFDQATRDALTGAFNRRQFETLAASEVQRSRRYGHPFCILMIDADHFKKVNDTYGHATGDRVLQALSRICHDALRETDIIARFGGEEFVVLLPEIGLKEAWYTADRLRQAIAGVGVPSDHGEEVRFTVSMGVTQASGDASVDDLIKRADEALYRAKENGRNRVEYWIDPVYLQQVQAQQPDQSQYSQPA